MPVNINVGGIWKTANPKINVGGVWKDAIVWVRAGSVWKQCTDAGGASVTFSWTSAPTNSIKINGVLYGGTGSVVKTGTSAAIHVSGATGQNGGGYPDYGDLYYYTGNGGLGGLGGRRAANFALVNGETYVIHACAVGTYQHTGGAGGDCSYVEVTSSKYIAGAGGGGGGEGAFYDDDDGGELSGWAGGPGTSWRGAAGGVGGYGGTAPGGSGETGQEGATALVGGTNITHVQDAMITITVT